MLLKLFLAFTIIPVLEIYLLIKLGSFLGALNTVIIVILTGIIGAYLAKLEGLHTMTKVREALNRGEMPAVFGGDACRLGETPADGWVLPPYSITHVYLSPALHLGVDSISNALRPSTESAVISVTPIMNGDPPQLSKSRV